MKDKVPYTVKLQIIEHWAKKNFRDDWQRHALYGNINNFERAAKETSKVVKKNRLMDVLINVNIPNEYRELLKSGMFWVIFPDYTGQYGEDKESFIEFYLARENKWITEFLNGKND